MTCGAQGLKYRLRGLREAARQSSSYPSPSVVGVSNTSLWCRCLVLLYLVIKLPLVGVMWRAYVAACVGL
jgi:hypothetical protein